LAWLAADPGRPASLRVRLDRLAYRTGDPVVVTVDSERPCNLAVLALGAGGLVDVLYPNRRQSGALAAGGEVVLPGPGAPMTLNVRGPAGRATATERVAAVCLPPDASVFPVPAEPTRSYAADAPEVRALDRLRKQIDLAAIATQDYEVGPKW
jgi:hypothetical protein